MGEKRVGIGKQNHFHSAIFAVTWVDLLGYGSMLRECNFDPTSKQAKTALVRLEKFNKLSLEHSVAAFPILQVNDGIASWRELSFRTKSVTQDFIDRSLNFFYEITESEKKNGFPGPRMVISAGVRMKMKNKKKEVAKQRAEYLLKQIHEGKITYEQAVYTACNFGDFCNGVNALQANFAFTKSFLAEESGKNGGFAGNNVFIDMSFFGKDSLELKSINFDKQFCWNACQGLETTFARVKEYNRDLYLEHSPSEILSTLEISKKILRCKTQEEVFYRLKK